MNFTQPGTKVTSVIYRNKDVTFLHQNTNKMNFTTMIELPVLLGYKIM